MIFSVFLTATTCALIQLSVRPWRLTFLITIVAPGAPSAQAELLSSASNPLNFSEFIFLKIWLGGVHYDYIIKKANHRLYALRSLKKCGVPASDLITVYCSLIRSVIEYASAVFGNLPKYLSDALEGIQTDTKWPLVFFVSRQSLAGAQVHLRAWTPTYRDKRPH